MGQISINFCFGPFSINESYGGDNSTSLCRYVLHLFVLYFFPYYTFRVVLNLFTPYNSFSAIFLEYLFSDSKEESFLWVDQLRTDALSCDFSVFISKLSECKQVEFSAAVLAAFVNLKSFFSSWMVSAYFPDFYLY